MVFASPQLESLSLITAGKTSINVKCATITVSSSIAEKNCPFLSHVANILILHKYIANATLPSTNKLNDNVKY